MFRILLSCCFLLLGLFLFDCEPAQAQVNDKIRNNSNNRGSRGNNSGGQAGGGFSNADGPSSSSSFAADACANACVQFLPLFIDVFGQFFQQYHQELLSREETDGPLARISSLEARLPLGADYGQRVVAFRPRLTGNWGLYFAEARGYLNTEIPGSSQAVDNLSTWSAQLGLNLFATEYFNLKLGTGITDLTFVESGNQRVYHEASLRMDGYYEAFRYGLEARTTPPYENHRNRARDELGAWAAYRFAEQDRWAVEGGLHFRYQNWFQSVDVYYSGIGLWLRWQ